jgi:hypothetical protein
MHRTLYHALPLFAVVAAFGTARAQTTVTVPCDHDNTLYQSSGSVSNALGPSVFVGVNSSGSRRRAVLHFDVAAVLPAGAKVVAATLTLNVVQSVAFLPVIADAHRLTRSWGEGTSVGGGPHGGQGVPATTGDATWTQAFFPSTPWTTPGGDFVAAPSFSLSMPSTGLTTMAPSAGAAADVQFWLANPSQNFGWLLEGANETLSSTAHRLDSRNGGTLPPALSVTYLLPGQNGSWGTGCPIGAANFTTAFSGAPLGGTTINIVQSNATPLGIGANFFSLALDPAGTALSVPGCRLYLPSASILIGNVFFVSAAGTASSPLALPPGFPGYLVTCQAALADANPLGYLVSSAALLVLQ